MFVIENNYMLLDIRENKRLVVVYLGIREILGWRPTFQKRF